MDDLLSEFLMETSESLDNLDSELVKLEQNPNDPELLGSIFRLVHTIKGTCGFLGLPRLETVAHAGENVLGNFRDGTQVVTPDAVSLILEALDRIKELMAELERNEAEPAGDDAELIARLDAMYREGKNGKKGAAAPAAKAKAAEPAPVATAATAATDDDEASDDSDASEESLFVRVGGASAIDAAVELVCRKIPGDPELAPYFADADMPRVQAHHFEYVVQALGGPKEYEGDDNGPIVTQLIGKNAPLACLKKVATYLKAALSELEVPEDLVAELLPVIGLDFDGVHEEAAPVAAAPAAPKPVATPKSAAPKAEKKDTEGSSRAKETAISQQSIRVSVELLENLMTTVSELVLTRNQLLQMVRKYEDSEFKVPLQRLGNVTTDLQEGVMKTRMQPIGNAWGKLPRIVRDLALELGKKIDLEMYGAETELDRQVLEMIKDPLTHMVRNSADHGLEMPSERVAAGKAETGRVVLNAYHEGGHIIIEISDDGHGISTERVKAKALSNGLATEAELEALTDQQIHQFIFKAGFSTAEKVTNVSGRGVGMDVVRTNIEKIGGHVELQSTEGKGSTFSIKIPLTLAIVSALIVESGGERFAIPQISVVELVRVSGSSEHRIETIKDTPVLRLRNRLLPLVSLSEILRLPKASAPEAKADRPDGRTTANGKLAAAQESETFIIVTQVGTSHFGIIVDRVFDTEEIVVKPVAPILRNIQIYSGNTILGDGSVIMILDPNGIAAQSGAVTMANQTRALEKAAVGHGVSDRVAMLMFKAGGKDPKAVPLALVARLEEVDRETIEMSGGKPVIQYRGQLMPLISMDPSFTLEATGRQPVVVFSDQDRSMGLMVDSIVDIVEDRLTVEMKTKNEGILGTAVISGKATDIIDTSYLLTMAFDDWFASKGDASMTAGRKVLLVDDSPFFRNLLTPLLTVAGYDVTSVESADKALQLRETGSRFDVIVSDIEMPGMNGFEFAKNVRGGGAWQETPIVALSSRTSQADLDHGRSVGFADYVAKLDRTALLDSLSQTLLAS